MKRVARMGTTSVGRVLAAFACLGIASAQASEPPTASLIFSGDSLGLVANRTVRAPADPAPYPLLQPDNGGLHFDLAGSDKRKLQLVLQQPLSLSAGMTARPLDSGADVLGLDATLSLPVAERFSLQAGAARESTNGRFYSLGSIQCLNGTLRSDSYTASGCRFVNESAGRADQSAITLGAQLDFDHASASVNWFSSQSSALRSGVPAYAGTATIGNGLMSPNLVNPLFAPRGGDPLSYLNAETSGVDLAFQLGIATDTRGDLRLGLAFSSVLQADYQGLYLDTPEAFRWTLAEPFNTARMNLEWSRGAFSTGIQGYYRESVDFLNRDGLDSLTTFDVHFTWRTPWNANLSVGATNVLNAGTESGAESPPADPLEPFYGRIPYVRYKQDL